MVGEGITCMKVLNGLVLADARIRYLRENALLLMFLSVETFFFPCRIRPRADPGLATAKALLNPGFCKMPSNLGRRYD